LYDCHNTIVLTKAASLAGTAEGRVFIVSLAGCPGDEGTRVEGELHKGTHGDMERRQTVT